MSFLSWLFSHDASLTKVAALGAFAIAIAVRSRRGGNRSVPCPSAVFSIVASVFTFTLGLDSSVAIFLCVAIIASVAVMEDAGNLSKNEITAAFAPAARTLLFRGIIAVILGTLFYIAKAVLIWRFSPLHGGDPTLILLSFDEIVRIETTSIFSSSVFALGLFGVTAFALRGLVPRKPLGGSSVAARVPSPIGERLF